MTNDWAIDGHIVEIYSINPIILRHITWKTSLEYTLWAMQPRSKFFWEIQKSSNWMEDEKSSNRMDDEKSSNRMED